MNNARRRRILTLIERMTAFEAEIDIIRMDEEEERDAIPEAPETREAYQEAERAAEAITEAMRLAQDCLDELRKAKL